MENKDRFFIPKTIRVGYQNRRDTYTKKLAYVIYIDHTGKVRKEASWKSWRDSNIEPNDFENVPTEGFVLNMHVGGYKSDWNFRQSYCRVYDPRGFEIEITIDNLLWILDWCDCYHGKGLEGKFVYGWIFDELTLIPVVTDDYVQSNIISEKMYESANTKPSDFIPGSLYRIKNMKFGIKELVFIGNLKMQQKFGTSYKSTLMFAFPKDLKTDSSYANIANINHNDLIIVDKKNVMCKISDNAITQEELDDYLYRWSICAFSYDFWKTTNVIDKFVSYPQNYFLDKSKSKDEIANVPVRHTGYNSSKYSYEAYAKLTDDKHVTFFKEEYYSEKDNNSYSRKPYRSAIKYYEHVAIDSNCNVTKLCDFGKVASAYHESEYRWHNYPRDNAAWYPSKNRSDVSAAVYGNRTDIVFYITKDGYISNSLNELAQFDMMSFVDVVSYNSYKYITLPTKILMTMNLPI